MFRMWVKLWKNGKLQRSMVVEDDRPVNRTKKVLDGIDRACVSFDVAHPIWLEKNEKNFLRLSRTRFSKDNFIEAVDFDFFEIRMIEED